MVSTDNELIERGHRAPQGECILCDQMRKIGEVVHPPHKASDRCESGKRRHCTCDTCF